ncbi:MAG: hypothetical protein Q8Q95_02805 [bacterium]|nr:hypothetical protein [bacterium]
MAHDRFTFNSAGQTHELEMAMDRAGGYNAAIVKRMCKGDRLTHIREYLLGLAEITYPEHIINCSADPFVPEGWSVEEHQKSGSFKWSPAEVQFYLSELQKQDKVIKGDELRHELAGKPVYNANVLDYLLAHPHLIPEAWKKDEQGRTQYIFFWGTIYRGRGGGLYVRCLCWGGCGWGWGCGWLGGGFRGGGPVALRA